KAAAPQPIEGGEPFAIVFDAIGELACSDECSSRLRCTVAPRSNKRLAIADLEAQQKPVLILSCGHFLRQADCLAEVGDRLDICGSAERLIGCLAPPLRTGLVHPSFRELAVEHP